jgi:hypothetical protein
MTDSALQAQALDLPTIEPTTACCWRTLGPSRCWTDPRLGEGTGALLAWPLMQSVPGFPNEKAGFEAAGGVRAVELITRGVRQSACAEQ